MLENVAMAAVTRHMDTNVFRMDFAPHFVIVWVTGQTPRMNPLSRR